MKTSLLEILIIVSLTILSCGYTYKGEFIPLKERRVSREHYRKHEYGSRRFQKAYLEWERAKKRKYPSLEEIEEHPEYYDRKGYKWTKEQYERESRKVYYRYYRR